MKKIFILILLTVTVVLSVYAFGTKELSYTVDKIDHREHVIYLTTMGVSDKDAKIAKQAIEEFYGFEVKFIGKNKLPNEAYCSARNRYVAAKVAKSLRNIHIPDASQYNYKILALTNKDVEIEKNNHWGVMGLAFLGGDECVVSTYRMKGSVDRLRKVTLHETGHMLNIDHCKFNEPNCFMNDAKGKGSTVDRAKLFLCGGCRKKMRF